MQKIIPSHPYGKMSLFQFGNKWPKILLPKLQNYSNSNLDLIWKFLFPSYNRFKVLISLYVFGRQASCLCAGHYLTPIHCSHMYIASHGPSALFSTAYTFILLLKSYMLVTGLRPSFLIQLHTAFFINPIKCIKLSFIA